MLCAACGSSLPDGARFCPGCGARVVAAVPSETPAARHERRLLTVLFTDLAGFTAASDRADPEDVRARVRPFHALVRREAARTGGTVARVVGDGVMVVWGYPAAREDDALRALRAALRIHEGVRALPGDLRVRSGVNTGEAVVAFGAADERADDAMGDAVNVAARLASAAPVDGIVAGEATVHLVGGALHADAMPPLVLKGKAEPVAAWLVRGLAAGVRRPTAGPFLGREHELATLRAAFERAGATRSVVRVLVTGEPGIGKSRLAWELGQAIDTPQASVPRRIWHTGRCRADTASPGWALGEIARAWAGIADDDPPDIAVVKFEAAIPADAGDRAWLVDRLRPLAGLEGSGNPSRDEVAAAWAHFVGLLAADGPVVLELEDLHWADPDLAEFVAGRALGELQAPVLVLATGRPETTSAHPVLASLDSISLAPLADDAAAALVTSLAGGLSPTQQGSITARAGGNPLFTGELVRLVAQRGADPGAQGLLPDTVQAVIAARIDLLDADSRTVARDAAVVGERFWLGALEALAAGAGRPASGVDRSLAELVRLELVRPTSATTLPGDVEYAFRHALVRDAAYAQLTRTDRAARHAAIARWLADVAGADRGDLAGVVADHDLKALELCRAGADGIDITAARQHAYEHLLIAGAHAAAIDARAAASRYEAAAAVAETDTDRLAALLALARAQLLAGAHRDAWATASVALPIAEAAQDAASTGAILVVQARLAWHIGRPEEGRAATARAIRVLEASPPTMALADAYAQEAAHVTVGGGTVEGALISVARAIEVATSLGQPPPLGALISRGMVLATVDPPTGFADLRQAAEVARAGGNSDTLSRALTVTGFSHLALGEVDEAEAALVEAVDVAWSRGLASHAAEAWLHLITVRYCRGSLAGLPEDIETARRVAGACQGYRNLAAINAVAAIGLDRLGDAVAADALTLRTAIDFPDVVDRRYLAPAMVLLSARKGDLIGARNAFEDVHLQRELTALDFDVETAIDYPPLARAAIAAGALDLAEALLPSGSWGVPPGLAIADTLRGLLAAARGDHEDAERLLRSAVEQWDAISFHPEAACARESLADTLIATGRAAEARTLLHAAATAWRSMGAPLQAARIEARLAGVPGPA